MENSIYFWRYALQNKPECERVKSFSERASDWKICVDEKVQRIARNLVSYNDRCASMTMEIKVVAKNKQG